MKEKVTKKVKEYLLANCTEKKNAIPMNLLAQRMNVDDRTIRYSIRELRRANPFGNNRFLVSDLKAGGYWISDKKEEIEKWLKGYLSSALDSLNTAHKARKMLKHKLPDDIIQVGGQQLSLFNAG